MQEKLTILGTGSYLPNKVITSDFIDETMGYAKGHTQAVTKINQRHYVLKESASDMGAISINKALEEAQLKVDDLGCIISASGTVEQAVPCNAANIHAKLKLKQPIAAFDVNMTCLGSLMALNVAASLLAANKYRYIAIVASEIASFSIDWKNIKTAGLFGDGAAAMIVSQRDNGTKILAQHFETYSEGLEYCQVRGGGSKYHPRNIKGDYTSYVNFEMQGKQIYKLAANVLPKFVEKLLVSANLTINDIDWLVPHQASASALQHIRKKIGISENKLINILPNHGNQIAASIPTALDFLTKTQTLKHADKIMLLGTGAGLSVGGMILEY